MSDSSEPPISADSNGPITPVTLQAYLAEREEACPSCGYNLRGLQGVTCPECGVGLTLRVGMLEAKFSGLITAITTASLSAGVGGFFIAGNFATGNLFSWFERHPLSAWLSVLMFIVGIVGLQAAMIRRKRIVAMGRTTQRLMTCLPIVAIASALFLLFVDISSM